jgi:hypothetical protein
LIASAMKWEGSATNVLCSTSCTTTAFIFYRHGLFGNRIILDQNWALEAIYALLRPKENHAATPGLRTLFSGRSRKH